MAKRVEPDFDLTARVMFASDRTCCVCRDRTRVKVQLHHIDEDSSNTTFENLAVLCLDCHSDTRTTHAFARNLTPEIVKLYNESWRDLVRGRLLAAGSTSTLREYTQEVLFDLAMLPHEWKNAFMVYCRDKTKDDPRYPDVWELFKNQPFVWSEQLWEHCRPLFVQGLPKLIERMEAILAAHGNVIPIALKLEMIRAARVFNAERTVYLHLPGITAHCPDMDTMITMRFRSVFETLETLTTLAERHRKATVEGKENSDP